MIKLRRHEVMLAAALFGCCVETAQGRETAAAAATATAPAGTRTVSAETSAILSGLPAQSAKEAQERADRLTAAGRDAILEVGGLVAPAEQGGDAEAKYLLETLSWHVGRQGADAERQLYADALAEMLKKDLDPQVKAFFLEQLGRVGRDEAAGAALGAHLTDGTVGENATRALLATGADNAAALIRDALGTATGRVRISLIGALGDLRAKDAATDLAALAASDDADVRDAALGALANMGASEVWEALEKAEAATTTPMQLGRIDSWKLLYATRVAEAGEREKGERIARDLMAKRSDMPREAFRIRGLGALAEILKKDSMPDLLEAMKSPSREIRTAALNFAQTMEGEDVTTQWVEALATASPEAQADVLAMLGRRGDLSALPAVEKALDSEEGEVALRAVSAAADLGGTKSAAALLGVMKTDRKPQIEAAQQELQQMAGEDVLKAAADALAQSSDLGKIALLDLLSARNAGEHREAAFVQAASPAPAVRTAAFKALDKLAAGEDLERLVPMLLATQGAAERKAAQQAVASAAKGVEDTKARLQPLTTVYATASDDNKESILATLSKLGGTDALEVVTRETSSTQPAIQTAAVRALGEWPDAEAMPRLLEIFRAEGEENHHVLAGRGYIRLLDAGDEKPREKLKLYQEVLKHARRAEEKQLVLASLGEVKTTDSLRLVARYLDDDQLRGDAALSAAKIANPKNNKATGLIGPEVAQILLKAAPSLTDKDLRKKTEEHINQINYDIEANNPPADAEGFVPLFNGSDLTGWTGSTDGYKVEDGVLVCIREKGGNLYTEKQYDDFVLRFEFKLEPGANNGLAVRAPLGGDAAYAGMELQILDDTAPKYADLKPYQYHGAVYGIAAPKLGHQKPVGEWNEQEVTAKGGKITVKLNGAVITEADLTATTGTLDGKNHPGMLRRQGHLGFLGHGSQVDFRNIRLKELINETPEGFTALFNGKDLSGWKGLVANPIKRAAMSPDELAKAQEKADQEMRDHWKVINGVLVFDGKGSHLCTTEDYGDFEMLVDWKLGPGGDSGIYVRGTPQIQIWDPAHWEQIGSGGLYNNEKSTTLPLELADRPLGEWNTFRIKMVGDKVTVQLNDKLVVDGVPLENYWDRKAPLFPTGQIELQNHGSPLYFRNLFIRNLTASN